MAQSGKNLVGYGDGFWGTEHFPIKFKYSDDFGFLIGQVGMNAVSLWEDQYYDGKSEVHGWGAPFKNPNGTLINNGVGTVLSGPLSTAYDNKIRISVKGNNSVGVKRGIKMNIMPTNTLDWMSADFSQCIQWQGPCSRYFEPELVDFWYSTNGGTPFVPGNVHWFGVQGSEGDYPVDVTLNSNPHTAHTVGVDWPFTVSHGNYNAGATTFLPSRVSGIAYNHDENFAPLGFEHLYGKKIYLNGKQIVNCPVDDSRSAKCQVDGPLNAVGQKGLVQGAAIRYLAPDYDYYTAIDDLDTYIAKDASGAKDAWLVVVTHEWYLHNATMKNIAYVADRVYTCPLWLQTGTVNDGQKVNPATLTSLAQTISVSTGSTKEQAIKDYKAEYRKWTLLGINEVVVDGSYPTEVTDWEAWHLSRYPIHNRGESYSFAPWLFNQSGNEATQIAYYRDPFATTLVRTNNPMIKKLNIASGPFGAVTFGYEHGIDAGAASDFYALTRSGSPIVEETGTALLAADYQGDTLVEATVSVDNINDSYWVSNETLNLPWALVAGKYTEGSSAIDDTINALCIGALDLRYNFIAFSKGTSTVDADNNFSTVIEDYISHNQPLPTLVGELYGPHLEEGLLDGPKSCYGGSRCVVRSFGDSLVFLNANTYALAHTTVKNAYWEQTNSGSYAGVNYLTENEAQSAYAYHTVNSSRYVYSRVVVNGVYLGSIDTVAGHYYPYLNSGKVNYSIKLG